MAATWWRTARRTPAIGLSTRCLPTGCAAAEAPGEHYRHLPPPARVLRRARALRPGARLHLARLAMHADRALARPPARHPLLVTPRRALRWILRPWGGQGVQPPNRGHLHIRHGGRQPDPGRDRGPRGPGAVD